MTQICTRCNIEKDKSCFNKGRKVCNFCLWKDKQAFVIPDGWESDDVYFILQQIFDKQIETINELTEKVDKSINDIIKLIHDDLRIRNMGNKPIKVGVYCDECHKYFMTTICFLLQNHFNFCSHKCYSDFRSKYYVGDKASVYTKIKVKCDYCGKEILIPKNKIETKNKEGISHNFCNHKCYSEFRKKYYVGDKLYNTGIKMSSEWKERCRINTVKCYSEGKYNRQTKPQIIVNKILENNQIEYVNEKNYKYYSVDNFLNKYQLGIEVMGDYFHVNPTIYKNMNSINEMQKKDIIRDKRKHTYILKYYDLQLLYLWESDILNEPEKCEQLIKLYIFKEGLLDDYQSYNYLFENEQLKLKHQTINPYFIQNP